MTEAALKSRTTDKPKQQKPGTETAKSANILPFEMPQMEVPAALSELAAKSVDQARQSCSQMTTAAEQMSHVFEEAYAAAIKSLAEYSAKTAEATQSNANLAFDLVRDLVAAKSFSDVVELSTRAMRQQSELLSAQTREFMTLAQKIASDTTKPMTTGAARMFKVPPALS